MITIYSSDSTGVRGNCLYPYQHEVTDAAGLRQAVRHDYVCAEYKGNYRSGGNFVTSNCLGMDCDNDHTDHEHEWITPDDVRRNFPDVPLAIHFSRHHMKPKDQKSATANGCGGREVPLSTFAGEPSQNVGKSFIKSYCAVLLEGAVIVLACIIFSLFASTPPVVNPDAAAVTQVWAWTY